MKNGRWRWGLGLIYILAVATIWIAASFVVQSVVDDGVSPFLVTYICNSLFVVLIPIVEIGRFLEDSCGSLLFWRNAKSSPLGELGESEQTILLTEGNVGEEENTSHVVADYELERNLLPVQVVGDKSSNTVVDAKGRWTRVRVAKVSLLICPFWFLAQLAFNLSLKYTTVTSNTILSTSSSLFTFLVALVFLGEKFTWVKFVSVILCMAGTIIVSLGDSESSLSAIASNPLLGDVLAIISAMMYSVYITLIRINLPDDDHDRSGQVSTAQFLGFLGLFNLFIFFPVALILDFTRLEPFKELTKKQFGLIIGKGLLDNVLSDYLWAKAVLLTTTTVATAGLTIQVPLAAVVDTLRGNAPRLMVAFGALAVMIGFAGINIPTDTFSKSKEAVIELENDDVTSIHEEYTLPTEAAVGIS